MRSTVTWRNASAGPERSSVAVCRRASRWIAVVGVMAVAADPGAQDLAFDTELITASGPRAPWGKAVADINQDGLDDVIVAGHQPRRFSFSERIRNKLGLIDLASQRGELVWYAAPDWQPNVVATDQAFRTDVAAGDVDGDGDVDLVALSDSGVILYRAPDWAAKHLDSRKFHDVVLGDLDGDDRPEIVLRNQSLFGYDNGNAVFILWSGENASPQRLMVPHGEGLALADMNADGRIDIVANAELLLNQGQRQWRRVGYAAHAWPHVTIAVADFNGDGRPDIALAPAEEKGQKNQLSWFESPDDPATAGWIEHVVLTDIEAVHHALVAADFDRDGHVDLVTAKMNQGDDPDSVLALRNLGSGESFSVTTIGTDGSHNLQLVDAEGDFDFDVIGTNWQRDDFDGDYPVTLWHNPLPPRSWRRHVIDAARPGQAVAILTADLDDDGWNDLLTGGYRYLNPGRLDGVWRRAPLGAGANNASVVSDFDGDGDIDVLANGWRGYAKPTLTARVLAKLGLGEDPWTLSRNSLALALNDGQGGFEAHDVVAQLPGDFVHGAAHDPVSRSVVLSLHASDTGLQVVQMPNDANASWMVRDLPGASEHEALTLMDIDGDGRQDIVTGSRWVDGQSGQVSELYDVGRRRVDRHKVIDVNGDGALDVITTHESPSRVARIAWFSRPDQQGPWTQHEIGTLAGPMSLDAGDVDLDGDTDIIVGEHRLDHPERSRLVLFENRGQERWRAHRIGVGDEHHDGALLVDLDRDGDLDVASIGWTHGRVLVYENPTVQP